MHRSGLKKFIFGESDRVANVFLAASVVLLGVFIGIYFWLLPTLQPIRLASGNTVNMHLTRFFQILILITAIHVFVIASRRSLFACIALWGGLHIVVGLIAAPVLWGISPLPALEDYHALHGLGVLVVAYILRFLYSDTYMFMTTRGRYYD